MVGGLAFLSARWRRLSSGASGPHGKSSPMNDQAKQWHREVVSDATEADTSIVGMGR